MAQKVNVEPASGPAFKTLNAKAKIKTTGRGGVYDPFGPPPAVRRKRPPPKVKKSRKKTLPHPRNVGEDGKRLMTRKDFEELRKDSDAFGRFKKRQDFNRRATHIRPKTARGIPRTSIMLPTAEHVAHEIGKAAPRQFERGPGGRNPSRRRRRMGRGRGQSTADGGLGRDFLGRMR